MGFGALFLGVMFLYDFEIARMLPDTNVPYAVLDLFPDAIGWILLFFGLRSLARHTALVEKLRYCPVAFFALSLLTLAKGTVFFSTFYGPTGVQTLAGEALDLSVHLLECAFLVVFFSRLALFSKEKKDEKLPFAFSTAARLSLLEAVLFLLSKIPRLVTLPSSVISVFQVIGRLDFLFWILLVWWGAITLVRAMLRFSRS